MAEDWGTHPVYGKFQKGWRLCRDKDQEYPLYEVNEQCQVRNKNSGQVLKPNRQQRVSLYVDKQEFMRRVYQLCLCSFFPSVPTKETVDHIDENHGNSTLTNLQWLSQREQNQKSHRLQPRNNGPALSKAVQQLSLDGKVIFQFSSAMKAARVLNIGQGSISNCARGLRHTCKGWKWKYVPSDADKDLEGEEWATSDWLKQELKARTKLKDKGISKIRVSNQGRVLTAKGIKTRGTLRAESKYRYFNNIEVHQLVWWAFKTERPQFKQVICHDDTQPPDADGCCSNALCHLRLDSQRNNGLESWAVGDRGRGQKRKRDE